MSLPSGRRRTPRIIVLLGILLHIQVALGEDSAPRETPVLLSNRQMSAATVRLLRQKGVHPFTRDVSALEAGLADLQATSGLSAASANRLKDLLNSAGSVQPTLEDSVRRLDPSIVPRTFFEEVGRSLTAEELAAILKKAHGFEVMDPISPEDLPEGTESTTLESLLEDTMPEGQVVQGENVPSKIPGTPPIDVLAAKSGLSGVVVSTDSIVACSKIAEKYNIALESAIKKPNDHAAQLNRINLGSQVDELCFVRVPTPEPPELQVFGILELPVGQPHCSAVVTGTQTIVTARHCFFDEHGTAIWQDIVFRPWLQPTSEFKLQSVRLPSLASSSVNALFSAPNDVAEATLTDSLPVAPHVCWQAPTQSAQPLGLFGYLSDAAAAVASDWTARIRLNTGGTCVAQQQSDRCFVHFCNAVGGFSGSPLFSPPDGSCPNGVRVVGLHLAASGKSPACSTLGGNDAIVGQRVAVLLSLPTT